MVKEIFSGSSKKTALLKKIVVIQGILENDEKKALKRAEETLKRGWRLALLEGRRKIIGE